MTEAPSIQWFPGHMAKTRRLMRESLRLVDVVVEVIDARIPISSRNPELPGLVGQKPRIVLLNKCDAADEMITRDWCNYYKEQGIAAIPTDCRSGKGIKQFVPTVKEVLRPLLERRAQKGMQGAPIRMMIVGIPNSGKSTFINNVSKRRATKVGNRPGVTKTNQWIRINDDIHLLDTPGVLWHKLDKEAQIHLAWTGAIKDEIMDIETLAFEFIKYILKIDKTILENRYKIEATDDPLEVMEDIARKRGAILRGAEVDYNKVSSIILDEFRKGILGRITLEKND